MPHEWDSYDLDYAVRLKMKPQRKLLSREVAADGALCFIIRSAYAVGKCSTLTQDMIFYADSTRVDFTPSLTGRTRGPLSRSALI